MLSNLTSYELNNYIYGFKLNINHLSNPTKVSNKKKSNKMFSDSLYIEQKANIS